MVKTSLSLPSTPNLSEEGKSERQRRHLWVAFCFLVLGIVILAIILWRLTSTPAPFRVPERTLPVIDIQLLTPAEKQEARETGIACYTYDGIYYVNESLPDDFWNGWIHE